MTMASGVTNRTVRASAPTGEMLMRLIFWAIPVANWNVTRLRTNIMRALILSSNTVLYQLGSNQRNEPSNEQDNTGSIGETEDDFATQA
jgi:hypothetical protein